MELQDVTKSRIVRPGFVQYYFLDKHFEIILNRIDRPQELPQHNHDEAQFGYCYSGSFSFVVDFEKHYLSSGDSYNLISGVPHGATIIDPIITLDFKYLTRMGHKISGHTRHVENPFCSSSQNRKYKTPCGGYNVFLVDSSPESKEPQPVNLDTDGECYIFSPVAGFIYNESSRVELSDMSIYRVTKASSPIKVDENSLFRNNLMIIEAL